MADPKYAGLPGIDTSEKDIYESGDLPEDDQQWIPEELSSESVEKDNINTKEAFKQFNSKYVSGSDADFSEKLGSKPGYDTGEYSIAGIGEVETPTQKLQRLRAEVAQLSTELKSGSGDKSGSLPAETLKQVEILQSQLASHGQGDGTYLHGSFDKVLSSINEMMALQQKSTSSSSKKNQEGSYSLMIKPDQSQLKFGAKMSDIEARISKIEKAVGVDTEALAVLSSQTKHKNLKAAVEGLEVKRNMLDPEKLPQVDTRLQAVLNKLNEINKVRKQKGAEQVALDKKVLEIYDLVQKWDSVCASLPSIIHRLETLNSLHQQAADFSSTLQHMETVQNQIATKIGDTTTLAKQVDETFKQNAQTIQSNLQSLENRIQNLTAKK
ncbi:dynactin subunit 2-A-like [Styela clava]|uniref:dynactin subunit 2-A-like n=1 Tax=Styela clava TaxID=7725 RepID=UPI001939C104|nr:dynactin subunit 2-A-like [Styela clava]